MRLIVLALFLASLLSAYDGAPVGTASAGKDAWMDRRCRVCHGNMGEGGFGPDLAGRGLTFNQFKQATRKPWGIMPAFTERQASDQVIADMQAYLMTLPKVTDPAPLSAKGEWRDLTMAGRVWQEAPGPDAPLGQQLFASYGCMQCHGPEGQRIREVAGGETAEVNFSYLAKIVYTHTERFPNGRMGNFSRLRVPEASLREIYHFLFEELGHLVPLGATIKPGVPSGDNTIYTLELENQGLKDKGGLTAENLTIALALVPGTKVVGGTGAGYQGVRNESELNAQAAIWQVPSLAPKEKQTYTLTVSGSGGKPTEIFKGSFVRYAKPGVAQGCSQPCSSRTKIARQRRANVYYFPGAARRGTLMR